MIELYELNPHKMTTPEEKAQCVSWFIETKSDIQTQRNYRSSGGYSNLGARGKNFQKLMLSEKKKRSDLGLHIFLPKSKCSLKKKKKVFTSISSLISLFFSQNQGVLQKKKKRSSL